MAPLITLLTDFGLTDAYVGIMKGVMLAIASDLSSDLSIVDLTHDVPPQDLWAARFNLINAVPYFPSGTIHVAVVDPGVGSDRHAIAIQLPHCILVGPDNGIFSSVFGPYLEQGLVDAIALTNPAYWRTQAPSTTFHGRDIFAPAAAHIACGTPPVEMGDAIDSMTLKTLDLPIVEHQGHTLVGCVQYGDRFGNLITNIEGQRVEGRKWRMELGSHHLQGQRTYGDVATGEPVVLIGSHGWVEIAVNGGSAREYFGVNPGETVTLSLA